MVFEMVFVWASLDVSEKVSEIAVRPLWDFFNEASCPKLSRRVFELCNKTERWPVGALSTPWTTNQPNPIRLLLRR